MIEKFAFHQTEENDITYIYTEFTLKNVTYMVIFSRDPDTLLYFQEDPQIYSVTKNKTVYSIKFAVKDYVESQNMDLYAPPLNHNFGKNEIHQLKQILEQVVLQHYTIFKPHCYVFTAERRSLNIMYQKMCSKPNLLMLDFVPITHLGDNQDCFILKTPNY